MSILDSNGRIIQKLTCASYMKLQVFLRISQISSTPNQGSAKFSLSINQSNYMLSNIKSVMFNILYAFCYSFAVFR